jgi:hypothetical protein
MELSGRLHAPTALSRESFLPVLGRQPQPAKPHPSLIPTDTCSSETSGCLVVPYFHSQRRKNFQSSTDGTDWGSCPFVSLDISWGCTIAQTDRRCFSTPQTLVRSQVGICGVCGEHSDNSVLINHVIDCMYSISWNRHYRTNLKDTSNGEASSSIGRELINHLAYQFISYPALLVENRGAYSVGNVMPTEDHKI